MRKFIDMSFHHKKNLNISVFLHQFHKYHYDQKLQYYICYTNILDWKNHWGKFSSCRFLRVTNTGIHQEETPTQKMLFFLLQTGDFVTFWWYYFDSVWKKYLEQISSGMALTNLNLKEAKKVA